MVILIIEKKNCADDGEYRKYCDISASLCIDRYYKNRPKSGTHINNIHKRKRFNDTNTNNQNYLFPVKYMFVMNITDEYNDPTNCADNRNEDTNIIFKVILLSIASSTSILCLISLINWTILKLLITNG